MVEDTRHAGRPEPGFFVWRYVKGGPPLPARIWRPCLCSVNGGEERPPHEWRSTCDRFPRLEAQVDGKPFDVNRLWETGERSTAADFTYLTNAAAWDRAHDSSSPYNRPDQPADLRNMRSIF